jgi:hypothetical protein
LRAWVTIHLRGLPGDCPLSRAGGPPISHAWPCSGWGLPSRPGRPGRWCALTAPFHPHLCGPEPAIGGLFSVALSCGSPRLAVSQHPALWSPDFPRPGPVPKQRPGPRPPGRLTVPSSVPVARWSGERRGSPALRELEPRPFRADAAVAASSSVRRTTPSLGWAPWREDRTNCSSAAMPTR